jgi:hypothetical protein
MKKVLFFAAMLGLSVACADTKKVEENKGEEAAAPAVEVVEEAVEAPATPAAPAEVVVEATEEAETPELPSVKTELKVEVNNDKEDGRFNVSEAPKTRVEEKKPAKNVPLKPGKVEKK